MDLAAYAQINDLCGLAKEHGILVPRLRGYRLMTNEEPVCERVVKERAFNDAMQTIDMIVRSGRDDLWIGSSRTNKRARRFLIMEGNTLNPIPIGVRWDKVHGKLRKKIKFEFKKSLARNRKQFGAWNRYCGKNVLYIHARIGGGNWGYYCDEVKTQPWFLEKVDDAFDDTYCDIYARLD